MKSVSIRDIEKGIVRSQSPFNQQIGSFSHFFSEDRKRNWHRINMENLLMQNNINQTDLQNILMQGFKIILQSAQYQNMKLDSIDSGIQSMSNELLQQKKILENSNSVLNEILESIKNPRAIEAKEKANQASENIKDALSLEKSRAERLLDEAITLLEESIKINDYDFKAHFDLGWLYSFYKNDYEKAEYHFDTSVLRSISNDKKFAAFSLRHLADTKYHSGNIEGAIKAVAEAEKIEENKNLETTFEYARYLVEAGKDNVASIKIESIIKQNPIHFALTEKEIDVNNHPSIQTCLKNLTEKKRNKHKSTVKNKNSRLKNKYHDALDIEDIKNYLETKKNEFYKRIINANYFQLASYTENTFNVKDKKWRTNRDVIKEKDEKEEALRIEKKNQRNKAKLTRRIVFLSLVYPILLVLGFITTGFGMMFSSVGGFFLMTFLAPLGWGIAFIINFFNQGYLFGFIRAEDDFGEWLSDCYDNGKEFIKK